MVNRPRNIGIDTDILQDFTARTKAIQNQTNDELTAFGVMRPKSEEEKLIANLKRFADQGVPVPTAARGSSLAETNARLERSINDPYYKKVKNAGAEARTLTNGMQGNTANPAGQRRSGILSQQQNTADTNTEPNFFDKTAGRVLGMGGRGVLGVSRAIGEFAQDRIPVPEETIAMIGKSDEQFRAELYERMGTDQAGWDAFVAEEGQAAADILFYTARLHELGSNTLLVGKTDEETVENLKYRLSRLNEPYLADKNITVAEHMLRQGHNPASYFQIPLAVFEASEGVVTLGARVGLSQAGRQIDIAMGGDGSKGEMIGDMIGSLAASPPKNPAAGLRTGDGAGTVFRNADDVAAGLKVVDRPIQSGAGVSGALGIDFMGEELRDIGKMAKVASNVAKKPFGKKAVVDPVFEGAADLPYTRAEIADTLKVSIDDPEVDRAAKALESDAGKGVINAIKNAPQSVRDELAKMGNPPRVSLEELADSRPLPPRVKKNIESVQEGMIEYNRGEFIPIDDPRVKPADTSWNEFFSRPEAAGVEISYDTRSGGRRRGTIGSDGTIIPDANRRPGSIGKSNDEIFLDAENLQPAADRAAGIEIVDHTSRGKRPLIERLQFEVRKNDIDPDIAEVADIMIRSLPDETLEELGSSFFRVGAFDFGDVTAAGFYDTESSMINIAKGALQTNLDPEKIIPHEIAHHLKRFITDDEYDKLIKLYKDGLKDGGQKQLDKSDELMAKATKSKENPNPIKLTDEDRRLMRDAYRWKNSDEFFAEIMSDRVLRDIYERTLPNPERDIFAKLLDKSKDLTIALYNVLIRRGRTDDAERMYQRIFVGDFDPEIRQTFTEGILYRKGDDVGDGVGRPNIGGAADDAAESTRNVINRRVADGEITQKQADDYWESRAFDELDGTSRTGEIPGGAIDDAGLLEFDIPDFGPNPSDLRRTPAVVDGVARPNIARQVAGGAKRVTVQELRKTLDAARAIATFPLHPRQSIKGAIAVINNQQVLLTGNVTMDKLIQGLSHATDVSAQTSRLVHKRKQEITAQLTKWRDEARIAGDTLDMENATKQMNAAMKGEYPKAMFELPPELMMTPDEMLGLRHDIFNSHLSPWEARNADFSLMSVFSGENITKSQIDELVEVFGPGFRNAMNRFRSKGTKFKEATINVLGMPINFQSSYDLSAPFRQGFFFMTRMPLQGVKAMKDMTLAFFDAEFAAQIDLDIRTHENYRRFKDANLYFADVSSAAGDRSEVFISSLPSKIPIFGAGFRASNRAYNTFLNKMRMNFVDGTYKGWQKPMMYEGKMVKPVIPQVQLEKLTQLANFGSGRGPMPGPKELTEWMSVMFYAPRLVMSRFVLPLQGIRNIQKSYTKEGIKGLPQITKGMSDAEALGILQASGQLRRESARLLVQGFGAWMGVAALVETGGRINEKRTGKKTFGVELDFRSNDVGKLRFGSTRIDPSGGMQPMFRMLIQLMTQQGKTTGTGSIVKKESFEVIGRFLRSKFSPSASLTFDLAAPEAIGGGTTFIGEDTISEENGIGNLIWERFAPLYLQDIVEAMHVEGIMMGGVVSAPGLVGFGITSFKTSRDIANDRLANDIIMTDENGDRIYDIQDPRMSPAQKSRLLNDKDIKRDMEELNRRSTEDEVMQLSEARDYSSLVRDVSLAKGEITGKKWKGERSDDAMASAEVYQVVQALEGDFRQEGKFGGVAAWAMEMFDKNEIDRTPEEQAVVGWYEITKNHVVDPSKVDTLADPKNLTPEDRKFLGEGVDYDPLEEARNEFLAGLTAKQTDYLLENIYPDRSGTQDYYIRGQRNLKKPYYDIPSQVAETPAQLAIWEQYNDLNANDKFAFAEDNPSVKWMAHEIGIEQKIMREENKELDEFMVIFDEATPVHDELMDEGDAGFAIQNIRERVLSGVDAALDESLRLRRTAQ